MSKSLLEIRKNRLKNWFIICSITLAIMLNGYYLGSMMLPDSLQNLSIETNLQTTETDEWYLNWGEQVLIPAMMLP